MPTEAKGLKTSKSQHVFLDKKKYLILTQTYAVSQNMVSFSKLAI